MKILLKLKYVGTAFHGFQVQPKKRTVQSTLQDAIEKLYGVRYDIKGCSRTDSGVHANVYYATYDITNNEINIPAEKIPYALNNFLDEDISITDAIEVPADFHVRHNVISKEYVYRICCAKHKDPFENNRSYFYNHEITDEMISLMNDAGKIISGKHDFKCFMASGSSVADTVRNVEYVKVVKEGDIVNIYACADGFLYNMVRIIAGTLLDAARGKLQLCNITGMLEKHGRAEAGPTLPAHGLYLNKVKFDGIYF